MNKWFNILILTLFAGIYFLPAVAQNPDGSNRFLVPMCVYQGDTIPFVQLRDVYVFKPKVLKNEKEQRKYDKLVRNVKKTLPLSREIYNVFIETYKYLQTLPDEKAKNRHIKEVEKGLKEQYTPRMKKLTFSQGKILIKLIDRQCNQSSYELVKAFLGPFRAGFYQTFAALFGASLKKEYDPTKGEDKLIEEIILLVDNGQL
jgi:hypothetical protein